MNPGLEIKYLTYSELDSTQSEAWRYLEENEPLGWTAIAADWQTQGRGQRGSGWQNGRKGNVFLSVLSPPLRFPAEHLAALQAQLAVSAVEALQDCGLPGSQWTPQAAELNGPHWGIKWPNDLVLGGRKLGGILVEGRMQHAHKHGLLQLPPNGMEDLSEIILVIGRYWLDFSKKKYPEENNHALRRKGLRHVFAVLGPYLTGTAKGLIEARLGRRSF